MATSAALSTWSSLESLVSSAIEWAKEPDNRVSLIVVIALVGTTASWIFYRRKFSYWKSRRVPGPRPIWLGGTLIYELINSRTSIFSEWIGKFGYNVGLYHGTKPLLLTSDPEVLKRILVKDAHIFSNHGKVNFGGRNTEHMLFFMRGERWKSTRSLLAFSMTSGKIKRLFPLIKDSGDEMLAVVGDVAKRPEGENILDTKTVYGCHTMDVIARAAFAMRFDSPESEQKHRRQLVKKMIQESKRMPYVRIILLATIPKPILSAFGFKMSSSLFEDYLDKIVTHIIETRRQSSQRHEDLLQTMLDLDATQTGIGEHLLETVDRDADEHESHHVANADKDELQQVLANASGKRRKIANVADNYGPNRETTIDGNDGNNKLKLTDREIIANCILFLFAGYETTSSLLSYCSHTLAHHPDKQEKLFKEIHTSLSGGEFTYEQVISLPYLDAVISETLRLFPPATMIDRQASQDYHLDHLNLTLNKGQLVLFSFMAIHRDPKFYSNPDSFEPERFMPENRHKLIPYTYLPFGAGIRHCIGMRMALAEAKMATARLVYNFRFSPAPGSEFPPKFQRSFGGLRADNLSVRVTARSA